MPRISPPRGETKSQRITADAHIKLVELAKAHSRNTVQEASLVITERWQEWKGLEKQ